MSDNWFGISDFGFLVVDFGFELAVGTGFLNFWLLGHK